MLTNQCLNLFHSCVKHLALESQLSFLQESCFLWHLYKLKRDGNSWKNTYKKFVRIMRLPWVLSLQDSFLMLKRFVSNLVWICRGKGGGELAISLDMSICRLFLQLTPRQYPDFCSLLIWWKKQKTKTKTCLQDFPRCYLSRDSNEDILTDLWMIQPVIIFWTSGLHCHNVTLN